MPPTGLSASTETISESATVYSLSSQSTIWTPISTVTIAGSTTVIYSPYTQSATFTPISTESITTTATGSLSIPSSSSTASSPNSTPSITVSSPQISTTPSSTSSIPSSLVSNLSPSSTTVTNLTPKLSAGGLSTGAKAGVAIGIVIAFLAVLLGFFFYLRRKRRPLRPNDAKKDESSPTSAETTPDPNRYELITKANTHEIAHKKDSPGLDGADESDRHEMITRANTHEMGQDKNNTLLVDGLPNMHQFSALKSDTDGTHDIEPDEEHQHRTPDAFLPELYSSVNVLEAENKAPVALELKKSASTASVAHSFQPAATNLASAESPSSEDENGGKMQVLQERIEKIREEKERLEKIQELKVLEDETKRQILAEAEKRRNRHGSSRQLSEF